MRFTANEKHLWEDLKPEETSKADDRAINERYARGEGRIVIETNREKLPGFVEQLKAPNYMDLRPFYQRRPRWSVKQQSLPSPLALNSDMRASTDGLTRRTGFQVGFQPEHVR